MKTECQMQSNDRREAFRKALNSLLEIAAAANGKTVTLATIMAGHDLSEVMRLFDAEYSEGVGTTIDEENDYRRHQSLVGHASDVLKNTTCGDGAAGLRQAAIAVMEKYLKGDD